MSPNSVYLNSFWENILEKLKNELSKPSYDTWIASTRLLDFTNNKLTIGVPNEFAKEWLENRYLGLIKTTIQNYLNSPVNLIFVAEQDLDNQVGPDGLNFGLLSHTLNPKYTFDTFVIGNGNRFAHAAALAVAESPAKSYNPLFLYGGSGLGKTHLMHAISHVITKKYPSLKILYVTGEQFTNELIDSIRYEKQVEFRNTYRKIDVLLIDDIQFLAGKEGTQEEFFHTFNTLYEANKQLIISSDRPPKEIPTLEEIRDLLSKKLRRYCLAAAVVYIMFTKLSQFVNRDFISLLYLFRIEVFTVSFNIEDRSTVDHIYSLEFNNVFPDCN
jgi:chromosomal replication initiator protein